MKFLFYITSAINTEYTNICVHDRFLQTLETIDSVRTKVPNASIILLELSPLPITKEYEDILRDKVDLLEICRDLNVLVHAVTDLAYYKSLVELSGTIQFLSNKQNLDYCKSHDRMFKLSGRYKLSDKFDINLYNSTDVIDKFVFKTKWFYDYSYLRVTRLWSLPTTDIEQYINILPFALQKCKDTNQDIEHSMYEFIPDECVYEVEHVGVEGYVNTMNCDIYYIDE